MIFWGLQPQARNGSQKKQTSPAFQALLGGDAERNYDHPSKPPLS